MVQGQSRPTESRTHFALRRTCGQKSCVRALRSQRLMTGGRLDHDALAVRIQAALDRGLNLTAISIELEISMQTAALICEKRRLVGRRTYEAQEDDEPEDDALPPAEVSPRQVREFWQTPLNDRHLFAPEVRRHALEVGP